AGACGIALFLATVERVTGDAGYRALVEGAVQPLRSALAARDARVARWLVLGAGVGMGGIVYALTRVGQLLDSSAFVEDARTAARPITGERIAADASFDVVAGAAGAILGLIALYEASGDEAALAVAGACGEHLLATRTPSTAGTPSATGYRAWATVDGK